MKKYLVTLASLAFLFSCAPSIVIDPDHGGNNTAVTVGVNDITANSAVLLGKANLGKTVASDLKLGFQYSKSAGILPSNSVTIFVNDADADYNFMISISKLDPETTYYFRAFIRQNGQDTFGQTKDFTTAQIIPDTPGGGGNEYKAPITIDGNFDDWTSLKDVTTWKCAATAAKTDIKLAKIYADKYYVFVYVEFDFSSYRTLTTTNFDFYINGDNNTATGGWKGQWNQGKAPCIDVMCRGEVFNKNGVACNYAPRLYKYNGAPNTSEWSWKEQSASGFLVGKGNKKAFEFQITRELYPLGKLANEFTMGIAVLVNGLDVTGALPNSEASETNPTGEAPLGVVRCK